MSARKPWWCMTGAEFLAQPVSEAEHSVARVLRWVVGLWLVLGLACALAERWGWL